MTDDHKKQIVLEYLAASLDQDIDQMGSFLTEDFRFFTAPSARENGTPWLIDGRQAYLDFVRNVRKRSKKWRVREYRPSQFLFDESAVAVRLRSIGEFSNGFVYDNEYVFIYSFRGEKICEIREFTDVAYIRILSERAEGRSRPFQ
jgi:ketosteroid isomerase-like protein